MTLLDQCLHAVLNLLFRRRDIVINDRLYLRRWYLRGQGTSRQWFLHNIRLPDEGRDFHDHPWPFRTRILSGGYSEHVLYDERSVFGDGPRIFVAGDKVNNPKSTFRHAIRTVMPGTYTMVCAGKAERSWGFWIRRETPGPNGELYKFVDHHLYLGTDPAQDPLEDRF